MRRIIGLLFVVTLAQAGLSGAQTVETTSTSASTAQQLHHFAEIIEKGPPLSLESARREAIERDPGLAELQAEMAAARQRMTQARSLDPPMVEGQIWQWPIRTLNPARVDMYMLSVGQEFPGRGKRALREAVAEKDIAVIEADVARRSRERTGEVVQTYVELFVARRVITIHQDTLSLLQQVVAATQARYESGSVPQSDVLAGVVELSKLHEDLIELDQEHQLTAAKLNALLQRDPDAPIGRLDEPRERPPLRPLIELQQVALDRDPDVMGARALQQRATAMQAEARGDLKPDIRVAAGYMVRPGSEDGWLASVGLTWPSAPWARKKIDARLAETGAERQAAQAKEQAARTTIRLGVHDAYTRAVAATQRAQLLRTTLLPQSRQAVAVSSIAYESNRTDLQAVLNEQRMLRESQLSYYRALADTQQAIGDLERLVGADVTLPVLTVHR